MPDRVAVFLISKAPLKRVKLICVALSEIKDNTLGGLCGSHSTFCSGVSQQRERERQAGLIDISSKKS